LYPAVRFAVAEPAVVRGFKQLCLMGTRFLMEGPVYSEALKPYSLSAQVPPRADRERINAIIFDQLVAGVFPEESRLYPMQ